MSVKTLQALALHKQWSGETSARVVFFTQELGVIHCLCKGVRTIKKQALLQAFTPLLLAVDERYDRYYLRSVESTAPTFQLLGTSLISGLYVNELLFHAFKPNDSDARLFDAYVLTLDALTGVEEKHTIESVLRRFEWVLLHACGYSFSLTQESGTGAQISADIDYQFVAGEGFVPCVKGIPGKHILALAADDLTDVITLRFAKFIMRQAVDHLLNGREIKTRGMWVGF